MSIDCKLTSACALLTTLLLSRVLLAQSPNADLILLHGHILTLDSIDSVAQAIAVRRGIIVKVGTDAEVLEFAGHVPGMRVIDLHGHTATPGLIDTHAHIAEGGVEELYGVKLSDATSVAEIVARVKAKIALLKPGEWVTGSGWDEGKLAERRYVTAADLDAVAPNNPVWLVHTTGHYGVANSFALKLAHITGATGDPTAGTIDRDARGNPTGVLKEDSAMEPVTGLIPPTTPEQMRQGILYIQKVLHSEGMTAVKDPDIAQIHWDAYKSLLDQGQLKERICVLWHAGSTLESARKALSEIKAVPRVPESLGDDRLLSCGVKVYMDGSGGARTGWVYDDWLRNGMTPDVTGSGAGNRGYPQVDPGVYREMVRLFHQNGVPVGTHAVGDRAMDWVVDSYALAEQEQPHAGLRHSIIHANLPTPHALEVMANLQKQYDAGYPEMQPGFLWWIGDIYAASYGSKRGLHLEPLKTLQSRGILWSGGSDYFVTPVAARYGLWASAARQTAKGTYGLHPFGMTETVDIHTALRSYTAWGARQMFLEGRIGTLEVSKKADIAIWDRDLYTIPTDQIKDLKCLMTLLDGEVVYRSPDSPVTTSVR
ncbi:MAG: amidohydrolase [Acidobacteria bacterium Pan2503]|uniref:Amidohydrolase n=1 Tax=Candidatus Acidiferrum panamense TaxID=2741543 RepID=A0A7V8NNI1_9BACT|nr:amidohydrolase [Candidatus Acidoferrum panamensis]